MKHRKTGSPLLPLVNDTGAPVVSEFDVEPAAGPSTDVELGEVAGLTGDMAEGVSGGAPAPPPGGDPAAFPPDGAT